MVLATAIGACGAPPDAAPNLKRRDTGGRAAQRDLDIAGHSAGEKLLPLRIRPADIAKP